MWQDYVISIIGFAFGFMLFPQIRDAWNGKHMNRWSSGFTTAGMFVLTICFGTMEMWISFAGEFFVTICWFSIWFLSYLVPHKNV